MKLNNNSVYLLVVFVGLFNEASSSPDQQRPQEHQQQVARLRRQTNSKAKQLMLDCLAAHNKYRRLHGVPELRWDEKLAAFAQKRSNFIARSDGVEFRHPPDLPYGENLFWHSTSRQSCEFMVRGWYDEIGLYNFKAPTFSPATGHFTQVIWRETERVGCATATSSGPKGGIYLTCNYDPPGNFLGEFVANVPSLPAGRPNLSSAISTTTTTTTTVAPTARTTTTTTTSKPQASTTKPKKKSKKNKKKKNKKNKKKKSKKMTTTTTTTTTTTKPARS